MKKVILFIFIFGFTNLINAADVKVGSEAEQSEEDKVSDFDKQYPAFKLAGVKFEDIKEGDRNFLNQYLNSQIQAINFAIAACKKEDLKSGKHQYDLCRNEARRYYVDLDGKLKQLIDCIVYEAIVKTFIHQNNLIDVYIRYAKLISHEI